MADTDFATEGQVNALVTAVAARANTSVQSTVVDDVVEISDASYTALGVGRPAGRLYLVTS